MPARRCSYCGIDWPVAFPGRCGRCGGTVAYLSDAEAIPVEDARSIKANADFARFLEAETPDQRAARRARYRAQCERGRLDQPTKER